MSRKKSAYMLVFILELVALALFIATVYVMEHTPLFRATNWRVEAATQSGKPVSAQVYRMLGRDMPLLIHIKGDAETPLYPPRHSEERERWFTVFTSNNMAYITTTSSIRKFPYLHGLFDPGRYGIDILLVDKTGEDWVYTCAGETVVFSNKVVFVSLSKEDQP